MAEILVIWALTFTATVFVHIAAWRIYRPVDYRAWISALLAIFVVGGGLIAAILVPRISAFHALIASPLITWCAVFLLQASVGVVYTFGYTLLLVGSPSLVILERLSATPAGLRIEEIGLPMTSDALVGFRVSNLIGSGLVAGEPASLRLTPRGQLLAGTVSFYRHLIGLRDGEGG